MGDVVVGISYVVLLLLVFFMLHTINKVDSIVRRLEQNEWRRETRENLNEETLKKKFALERERQEQLRQTVPIHAFADVIDHYRAGLDITYVEDRMNIAIRWLMDNSDWVPALPYGRPLDVPKGKQE